MVIFVVLGWLLTSVLHVSGQVEMILRTMFMGLAFAGFGGLMYFHSRRQQRKAQEAAGGQVDVGTADKEVETLVRDAQTRLAQSNFAQNLGRDAKLSQLPIFFIAGEAGAAKTSTFVNSGVEPDLLAGQVYQDSAIISTRPVNIWLAQNSVFVESGGKLMGDPSRWAALIKKLHPKRRWWFIGGKPQAPRAVIVCVDSEAFLQPNAEEALTMTARGLHTRLGEISQLLGIRLPVYVLFTKLDRLAFFIDFVSNLSDEEATQVLGVTLPLRDDRSQGGVYAEEESRRLAAAFDELFHSLCDKRPPYLARENDANKLPAVYEFPREFRKLRNAAVRFLVDLGRPSQLRANPFLRGFYFSGVRPVVVKEAAPVARGAGAAAMRRGATGLFSGAPAEDPLADPMVSGRTRRVPQWLFLGHLFSDVLLRDRAAMGASGQSVRAEMMRRVLAGCVACLCIMWALFLTISYFGNRQLEMRVGDAVRGIRVSEAGGGAQDLPSRDALERLDTLRDAVETLSRYEREGAPWSLRWGLYVGRDLYPPTRRLYFTRFHQLMFGATQQALLDWLRKLPQKPGPNDEYTPTYNTLKGYLITTSHHEKSTRAFLSPLLMERWAAGRPVDGDRSSLARKQFDFYSDELFISNPFSSDNDGNAVEGARAYLAQFNAGERIYQAIIAEASQKNPPVNFNKRFPGSAAFVANDKDVAGAFSADGWKFVEAAINNPDRFYGGEPWVLGNQNYGGIDRTGLGQQLRDRYHKDFLGNWRQYLANSEVVKYRSLQDASQKLTQLGGNQSYLLALFCLASVNTSAAPADVMDPYQPVQWVTPNGCLTQLAHAHNNSYLSALTALQQALDQVAKAGGNVKDDMVTQTMNAASNAYKVTRDTAQNFHIDPEGKIHTLVQKLMEDPIRQAEGLLGRLGPQQLNTQGRSVCSDFAELNRKYPFDTNSKMDATLDDINRIFRPADGKLATFYEASLKNYLDRQGNQFTRKSDNKVQITDAFLRFFNRAMAFSGALYKTGGQSPQLTYSMKALPFEVLKSVTLAIDGQTLKATPNGGQSQEFTWPGVSVHAARLTGAVGGEEAEFNVQEGLWAAFRFFGDADQFQPTGNTYSLKWIPKSGQSNQPTRIGGKIVTLPFQLDLKGAPPVFQKGYLSGFQCVSEVAR